VYNLNGRRDNKYKARIKILVNAMGIDAFREQVEAEWAEIRESDLRLSQDEIDKVKAQFAPPAYAADAVNNELSAQLAENDDFRVWYERNTVDTKCRATASLSYRSSPT
jgi:Sulfite reductase, beta subunit (hemoprotein)